MLPLPAGIRINDFNIVVLQGRGAKEPNSGNKVHLIELTRANKL